MPFTKSKYIFSSCLASFLILYPAFVITSSTLILEFFLEIILSTVSTHVEQGSLREINLQFPVTAISDGTPEEKTQPTELEKNYGQH